VVGHRAAGRFEGQVFPGVEQETWTYDEQAGAWYRHRFYRFEPDLNTENPAVRAELRKITESWIRMGVSGFRVDAVPFLIEPKRPVADLSKKDYAFLHELREGVSWLRGGVALLAEAHVAADEVLHYTGNADGSASRIQMIFAFLLNQAIMLALARQDGRPIKRTLDRLARQMSSASESLGGWPGPRRGSSSSSMVTYSAMTRSSRQACTRPPRRSTLR
jgi:maltose alpha-D-glucosyltransferase / alpha-amylase